jgi:uncharacterized protein (DUF1810 family)
MPPIDRFKTAQATRGAGYDDALREIRTGRKTGHWIWYVFPQIAGLGGSVMSHTYALRDAAEAADYLRDAHLRERLLAITRAVAQQLQVPGQSLAALMGSGVDARKLVSSLTLFEHVARARGAAEHDGGDDALAAAAEEVLTRAAAEGYPRCAFTLERLTRG